MLDINDVTQLMETMGFSTQHKLLLKATFAGWKKNPDAAFEALASAKVCLQVHSCLLFRLTCVSRLPLQGRRRRKLQGRRRRKLQGRRRRKLPPIRKRCRGVSAF